MSNPATGRLTAMKMTDPYGGIAKRIGLKLREIYASPEAEPLPAEHVELLLRLRHKERDQVRGATG